MHSSQMYTPGPAISLRTCSCDFPQKLHFSWPFSSPNRNMVAPEFPPSIPSGRRRHAPPVFENRVDYPVFLGFLGGHVVVPVDIPQDLLERLLGRFLVDSG